MERDPAIKTPLEVLLYPSFRVMIQYRKAHKLYQNGHYFLQEWISQRAARKTGIEIHPGAQIGKRGCLLTMETVLLLERQQLLEIMLPYIRVLRLEVLEKKPEKRHPTLRDNVMVSAEQKVTVFYVGEKFKNWSRKCRT